MSLTSDEAELLLKEATLGVGPSIHRKEALEYYERITKQIEEIRVKGGIVDIPGEMPDMTKEDDKPLDYCENKSIIPYGDNRSAPSFKDTVNEVSVWKDQKHNSSNKYFDTKLKELQEEYNKLSEEFKLNEMVYAAQCRFAPVIGEVYHLYEREDGSTFLSMVGPNEWLSVRPQEFIGSFKLTSNDKWEFVEYN